MISSRKVLHSALATLFIMCAACAQSSGGGTSETQPLPDTTKVEPQNPPVAGEPGSSEQPVESPATPTVPPVSKPSYNTDVLLFNGAGISTSDWQTTEKILQSMKLSYKLVNSSQLDAMGLDQMSSFGLILVPGGHSGTITTGLKGATRVRVRQAVRDRGVSYLGICAGAFMAVYPGASTDVATSYAFPVIEGTKLPMWYPNGNTSAVAAVTEVTFSDGTKRQLVWYGGPSTPDWTGGVVARYNNGKPAMSEATYGKGFVLISGVHPEAPQGWRNTAGYDSDGLDYDIMMKLVSSALQRKPLPTY